jgi:CRISPR type II-A/NMEMI-associated protein Csn2
MKLVNSSFEHQIIFDENQYTVLTIENPKCFRDYTFELNRQCLGEEGEFVLSENGKILNIKDHISLFFDYFSLDSKIAPCDSKLQSELKKEIVNDLQYSKGMDVLSRIMDYANQICCESVHNIEFQVPSLQSLLKFLKFNLVLDEKSEIGQLIDCLDSLSSLSGIDCFIFVNFFSFFSQEEVECFIDECLAKKFKLLFIEPVIRFIGTDDLRRKSIVIDKDFCEVF